MSKKNEPLEVSISPDGFLNMLMNQNGGAVVDELDRELVKGIGAILDYGGTADITLKVKLTKVKNMNGVIDIVPDVITKFPKEPREHTAMFLTPGNGVSAQQQKQEALDLQQAPNAGVTKLEPVRTIGEKDD